MFWCFSKVVPLGFQSFSQLTKLQMSFKVMCKVIVHSNCEIFHLRNQLQGTQIATARLVQCATECTLLRYGVCFCISWVITLVFTPWKIVASFVPKQTSYCARSTSFTPLYLTNEVTIFSINLLHVVPSTFYKFNNIRTCFWLSITYTCINNQF
jgi:hypothetical protein